ncbi:alpha/beta-hydrolase family protein [Chelativorans sp. AA-79]|uniref:alpha/beta hydrolase n=1 Tax=Chelativorans sp. AA-79 TaxID=3028735 RepID=UPI0023F89F36|nr:alpha/beta-hydrolase family protein [Chelativorans sp. AA-79]WEX09051.1 alpha/beta-hydrolase family protein [Chelativorans sp. AA-79]
MTSRRHLRLSVLPLMLGLVFFAASLTPSLIPRNWIVQGLLGGVVMALGYMIGRFILTLWRQMDLPVLRGRFATAAHVSIALPVLFIVALSLAKVDGWQNGIRARMGMPLLDNTHALRMILLAVAVFAVCFIIGWLVQVAFDRLRHLLYRVMPQRAANVAGLILVAFSLFVITRDGLVDLAMGALDQSYKTAQELFDTAPPAPQNPRIPGSDASFVDWGAMGQPGRNFVTGGPDAEAIAAFTGRPALDPIRVYVGRAEDDDPQVRADRALAELKRLGAFERRVLIVASPTGTGWLDPGSHDVVEYMHGGDIATVAVQYSYLQSPLALIFETEAGLDQATATIRTVHDHWKTLPEGDRPRLYIHGLSLGAWSSMYGTDLFRLLDEPIDGAFWTGPPFPSALWRSAMRERNPGTPYVVPKVAQGELIRFASHFDSPGDPAGWGRMRILYLQYSSDPIVFYEPSSLWRAPQWMREPPAPDVSPDLRFMPIVTQFQLVMDMALATTAPAGHGHSYYAKDYIAPWVAVTNPANWSDADSARLADHCDNGFKKGCDND